MADLITTDSVAETWVPAADLPIKRPWGIAVSPDGSTVYASCVGNHSQSTVTNSMTNGGLLAVNVATKAITVIASGRTGMKQALDCDSDGNVYWSDNSGTYVWDGSTSTSLMGTTWGLSIFDDQIYRHVARPNLYELDGTFVGAYGTSIGGAGNPYRGISANDNWIVYLNSDNDAARIWWYDRNTGTTYNTGAAGSSVQSVVVISDTEAYFVGHTSFTMLRGNPSTRAVSGLNFTGTGGSTVWGDIAISPLPRRNAYIAAGGVHAVGFFSQTDRVWEPDKGIVKIFISEAGGWQVGSLGFS